MKLKVISIMMLVIGGLLSACGNDVSIPASEITKQNEIIDQPAQPEKMSEQPIQTVQPNTDRLWQDAYIALLEAARADNIAKTSDGTENKAVGYGLYDIDKDDIPELLLELGEDDMSRHAQIYTYKDGMSTLVSSSVIGGNHYSFYTYPGKNGFIVHQFNMGGAWASCFSLIDGKLTRTTESFGETEAGVADIEDYIPGSLPVDIFDIDIDLPVKYYRTMQSYISGGNLTSHTLSNSSENILMDTIQSDGIVYVAKTNHWSKEIGPIHFSSCLKPGIVVSATEALRLTQYAWIDMNNDGALDCVLRLARGKNDIYSSSDAIFILSLQGQQVYAYPLDHFNGNVLEDSSFFYDFDGDFYRIYYEKNECFTFRVPSSEIIHAVRWEINEDMMYRVRASWEDSLSQIGAFNSLVDALEFANQRPGYHVYDSYGNRMDVSSDYAVNNGNYILPGSDKRYLSEEDLWALSWEECSLARNEIYARHGRIFSTPAIAAYFEMQSWYYGTVPAASFNDNVLNDIEIANIRLISNYEANNWGGSYYSANK